MTESVLLTETVGQVAVATLNRPNVLNVIDIELIGELTRGLKTWAADPAIAAVLVRGAGTRAFCAGGDVRAVYDHRGNGAFMDAVYRVEYLLDALISSYPKPYVVQMAGIVMGGGCGISVHGAHRIVTETTMLAMPECKIGLFPDVGASYFLARCPGALGMYAGLTGARFGAADAIYLNLADYFVPEDQTAELIPALTTCDTAGEAILSVAADPGEAPIATIQHHIDSLFGLPSVRDILEALSQETAPWARDAYACMRAASPISLEITFRNIREGGSKSLHECLITDFRIAQRLMRQPDYFEGVRAIIVDKDQQPRWTIASLDQIDPARVDAYFAPLGEQDLSFAQS